MQTGVSELDAISHVQGCAMAIFNWHAGNKLAHLVRHSRSSPEQEFRWWETCGLSGQGSSLAMEEERDRELWVRAYLSPPLHALHKAHVHSPSFLETDRDLASGPEHLPDGTPKQVSLPSLV